MNGTEEDVIYFILNKERQKELKHYIMKSMPEQLYLSSDQNDAGPSISVIDVLRRTYELKTHAEIMKADGDLDITHGSE